MYTLEPLSKNFFVHDGYSSGVKILTDYLVHAKEVFNKELEVSLDTEHRFCDEDEERLTKMFNLILEARRTWEEETAHLRSDA